jgi:hypothetical protein
MRLTHSATRHAPLPYVFLGTVPYGTALNLQHQLVQRRLDALQSNQVTSDILLLLEHTPVYTGGRRIKGTEDSERKRLGAFGADYFEVCVPPSRQTPHVQNPEFHNRNQWRERR